MANNDLKNLSRQELLEMLIAQVEENRALKELLDAAEEKLASRQIAVEKAGTLAEASLMLNGVLEAADRAAKQYLENLQEMEQTQQQKCEQMEAEAERRATAMIMEAEAYSIKKHKEADDRMVEVKAQVEELMHKQETLFDSLRNFMQDTGKKQAE